MIKIFKGDDSPLIKLALADGFDYSNASVEVNYQGAKRVFKNVTNGDIISFTFSREETAPMILGVWPVKVSIRQGDRLVTLTNTKVRIAVTDTAEEVFEGEPIGVDIRCGLFGIEGLPERFTDNDVQSKLNEIIRRLGGKVED